MRARAPDRTCDFRVRHEMAELQGGDGAPRFTLQRRAGKAKGQIKDCKAFCKVGARLCYSLAQDRFVDAPRSLSARHKAGRKNQAPVRDDLEAASERNLDRTSLHSIEVFTVRARPSL